MRRRHIGVITALAIGFGLAASPTDAADFTKGDIKISQPWTRVTPRGAKVAGGYMTITNNGKSADRLVGGSAAIAAQFEVHEMSMTDGVMRMRRLQKGLEIKPGQTVVMKPGSFHVMLMGLKEQVQQGKPVKGTLEFEKAGKVEIEYIVAPIGATSPTSQGSSRGMGHGSPGDHGMKH
jgi:copper(I)-binding protein